MRNRLLITSVMLLFAASVPVFGQSSDPRATATPYYVIQPNDVLQIFVWKEEALSSKVIVRPDGRISFPLIQDMQAAGLNPSHTIGDNRRVDRPV